MKSYWQKKSQRQEARVASEVGGHTQPASGATPFLKGDVVTNDFTGECKTTSRGSYSLTRKELRKIQSEAVNRGLTDWSMQIEFQANETDGPMQVAVIDWYLYLQLMEIRRSQP